MSKVLDPTRDALTGLLTRRASYTDFLKATKNAERVCWILADLDRFSDVNKTYGITAANDVLTKLASLFETCCSKMNGCHEPCRYGGEAFSFLLTDVDAEQGMEFADSLRAAVESFRIARCPELKVTIRLAVAAASVSASTENNAERLLDELMTKADRAVYAPYAERKRNGVLFVE